MLEKLESLLESVEDALGEWSGVERTYCPDWAVSLKGIQEDIKELIHDLEIEEDTVPVNDGEYIRGFHWSNKAWYAESNRIKNGQIVFGIYAIDGGTTGEMIMQWIELCGKNVPQLQAFDDSWKVLAGFKDVIDALALVDGKCMTDYDFAKILKDCGFKDLTAYEMRTK
jgi:hypothetical protein